MMKKSKAFLILLAAISLLCACGKKEVKSPDDKLLKADLNEQMNAEYSFLTLSDYGIVKSLREENRFTATINGTYTSKYAEFSIESEVAYTLYDQGWMLEDFSHEVIDSEFTNFKVTSHPTEEEALVLLEDHGFSSEDVQDLHIDGEGNYCIFQFSSPEKDFFSWTTYSENVAAEWYYNPKRDTWDISIDGVNTQQGTSVVTHQDLEGTYLEKYNGKVYEAMRISNVTDTSFDVEVDGVQLKTEKFTVHFDEISHDSGYEGLVFVYISYNTVDHYSRFSVNSSWGNQKSEIITVVLGTAQSNPAIYVLVPQFGMAVFPLQDKAS